MQEELKEQNKALFDEVRSLDLPRGQFALFGSTPMGIRGLKACNDIDMVVSEELFAELKEGGQWKVKIFEGDGKEYIVKGNCEAFQEWGPGDWNMQELIESAEIIEGLPFVTLENLLRWKKLNGREKDLRDVITIEQFLEAQ